MRRLRWAALFALSGSAAAMIAACSLNDGAIDIESEPDGATNDATGDSASPNDANDLSDVVVARARFCDLLQSDAAFFYCADFDDPAPLHGFSEAVTDASSITFGPSDASAPNLFSSTVVNPASDTSQSAFISVPFDFSDAGDGGFSYVSISFDLRVDSLSLDAAAAATYPAYAETVILALEPKYAVYAPIAAKAGQGPVMYFGTADQNIDVLLLSDIGDGGTPIGAWNHIRFEVQVNPSGSSTMVAFLNGTASPPLSITLSPAALTSSTWTLLVGMGSQGPVNATLDFDNIVVRSDKL